MGKTIKLRVKPVIHLPHKVVKGGEFIFTPDCDIPEKLANALLKTYPKMYEIAKGTADTNQYTFKQSFKDQTIQDIFSKLSDEDQVILFDFAMELLNKEKDALATIDKNAESKQLNDAKKQQEDALASRKKKESDAAYGKKADADARSRASAEDSGSEG